MQNPEQNHKQQRHRHDLVMLKKSQALIEHMPLM